MRVQILDHLPEVMRIQIRNPARIEAFSYLPSKGLGISNTVYINQVFSKKALDTASHHSSALIRTCARAYALSYPVYWNKRSFSILFLTGQKRLSLEA
jgi:hypothetical protein